MEPPIWAMRTGTSGSGFLVTIRSVVGFTAWTLSSVANPDCTTVLHGTMLRSYTALTASAVSGQPSWNFTSGRSVTFHVVSLMLLHDVVSPGRCVWAGALRVCVSFTVKQWLVVVPWVLRPRVILVA